MARPVSCKNLILLSFSIHIVNIVNINKTIKTKRSALSERCFSSTPSSASIFDQDFFPTAMVGLMPKNKEYIVPIYIPKTGNNKFV